ncbi:MAG: autotransporter outer membrane beta-barrel domain-containing protein [Deltaproteobacteria bacterium]|nr:autotransporter outer membrane beta-barrel domain-containing protein [Deltaproteobacteria bacterium]
MLVWPAPEAGAASSVSFSTEPYGLRVRGGNAGATGEYLDSLPAGDPYSLLQVVRYSLDAMDLAGLHNALLQISPERYDTFTQLAIRNSLSFTRSLDQRLDSLRVPTYAKQPGATGAPQSGDERPWALWGHAVGRFDNQSDDGEITGFDSDNWGFVLGGDYRINENFLVGLGLGYTWSNFDWNDSLGDGKDGMFSLGAYGSYMVGNCFLDATFNAGFTNGEADRRIHFGLIDRTANGDVDGWSLAAGLRTGYNWQLGFCALQPIVGVDFLYVKHDGFTESGADALNLVVDDFDASSFRGEVGANFYRMFEVGNWQLTPQVYLGYAILTPMDDRTMTAALAGQAGDYTITDLEIPFNSFVPRAGLTAAFPGGGQLFVEYGADLAEDYTGQRVDLGVKLAF